MRLALCAALCLAASLTTPSAAVPPKPDYAAAYGYSLRCFVAGGVAMPGNGDEREEAVVRQNARKAYDAVHFMGQKLGYSSARINADLDRAQAVEMRLMVQNTAYFEQTKASCVKLGLM